MTDSLLDRVIVAAPCPVTWESMQGTDTVRHCGQCSKNVYNLSAMTSREVEQFLQDNGATQCARFFRRADGKIMTDNCPAGLRKLRQKYFGLVAAVSGLLFSLTGFQARGQDPLPQAAGGISIAPTMGKVKMQPNVGTGSVVPPKGDPAPNQPLLEVPKNGDASVVNLYNLAKTNDAAGRDVVAYSYYSQALKLARKQKHHDSALIKQISSDFSELRKRMHAH